MSINDLLAKVNRNQDGLSEQVKKDTVMSPTTEVVLGSLDYEKLLDKYACIKSWLETHECQTGTNNKLDINDRPYDHEAYCIKLKEMEEIVCEIFSRPIEEGLQTQIRKYGL